LDQLYVIYIQKTIEKKVLVHDDQAGLVLEIRRAFINGETRGELLKIYGKRIGLKKNAFYNMFTNPLYVGKVFCKAYKNFIEETIEGKHQGIITDKEYLDVQKRLKEDESSKKGKTWFQQGQQAMSNSI